MTTRLVLNKFDVNLPPLATGLVIVIIVVVCGGRHAWALDSSSISVAGAREGVVSAGAVLSIRVLDVGHGAKRVKLCWQVVDGLA